MTFPGDDLVSDPLIVIVRHASCAAAPEDVWPWLVQLGRGRGGWYFPAWFERVIPRRRRGLRSIDRRPPLSADVCAFSWALLLEPDGAGGTHLHIRLRMDKGAWHTNPRFRFMRPAFDLVDWVTIVALFAGLRERLRPPG